MKSRKIHSKYYRLGWLFLLGLAVFILSSFVLIKVFIHITRPQHKTFEPEQTISVDRKLVTQIYFNNKVEGTGSLSRIIGYIKEAQHSVEITMFSFGSEEIKQALYDADKRGVHVTLILNTSKYKQHNVLFSDLPSTITRIDAGTFDAIDSRNTTYMHDKFMIIDRGFSSNLLLTGSLNFTTWGEKYNQSFFLITKDTDIISLYGKEFDLLKNKISGIKKLGVLSYNPWAATINYTDGFLEIWFSPGFSTQSIKYKILNTIESSKVSLDLIMWDLTDQAIASRLIKKAKEGVKIRIITEDMTATTKSSMIPYLQQTKEKEHLDTMEIILDTKLLKEVTEPNESNDFTPFIHHHSLIADGKTLILGSGNWSLWGFYYNDENALVTNNTYLITESQKTFDYFYKLLR